jgi:hypothetical protein
MNRAKKPVIIVLSKDTDPSFKWLSDGWYSLANKDTVESQVLYETANQCIDAGVDVPDVIKHLESAGFTVTRGVANGDQEA